MRSATKQRRKGIGAAIALSLIAAALGPAAAPSQASGPPIIGATWTSGVFSGTARLNAEINANGFSTSYHFDYITEAAYQANLAAAKEGFAGALRTPSASEAVLTVASPPTVNRLLFSLAPETTYRYRVVAKNSAGSAAPGPVHTFTTQPLGGGVLLADGRGWELVSPVQKNGGQVDKPGQIAGGGVLQAAANGGSVTYGSSASFAGGAGAPPASQYLATRNGGGWSTQNITAPIFSATYGTVDQGVPYQLFSTDLSRGLLFNGEHCRGEAEGCAIANPPLAESGAPAGYQNYYLRDSATGSFAALLTSSDVAGLAIDPAHFDLRFVGASPDLGLLVLSSCAALTANATEVALGEGCDPSEPNLYRWSGGPGLSLLNVLPGDSTGTPGASLAAQAGAVSEAGVHVYFTLEGNLYLREGATTKQVDADAGGGGSFEAASADGSVAFFTKGSHLWRYDALADGAADLTPSGGVAGVLGASAGGEYVYFQDGGGLERWQVGTTTTLAPGADAADPSDWPPATGTARVSADGTKLLFDSRASLTGFDNTDLITGKPDSEVFLYDASAPSLTCISCNPTGERPIGPSSIPGAIPNGSAPGSTDSYKPRVLTADGRRVFFESADALAITDTNSVHASGAGIGDAYQWEAQGEGSCTRAGGCTSLISSGRSPGGASFIDASADGGDAFFITDDSLVPADPGALDLYDARVGGGFPEPPGPIACEGDACQALPPEPLDPTLTTLLSGHGNPPVKYHRLGHHKKHHPKRHRKARHHRPQRGGNR